MSNIENFEFYFVVMYILIFSIVLIMSNKVINFFFIYINPFFCIFLLVRLISYEYEYDREILANGHPAIVKVIEIPLEDTNINLKILAESSQIPYCLFEVKDLFNNQITTKRGACQFEQKMGESFQTVYLPKSEKFAALRTEPIWKRQIFIYMLPIIIFFIGLAFVLKREQVKKSSQPENNRFE